MKKNEQNYEYLLRLYSSVDEYLSDVSTKQENFPEVVVSFCIVTEKILKIKLHDENPVLVYENIKFKENDALTAVVKKKEPSMDTIKIRDVIDRYKLMFDGEFTDNEVKVLDDIYKIRNHFMHGYKSDDDVLSDKENTVKKMGTVWEKISNQAISIFGKDTIKENKPRKKYSEEELEKVLTEEVKTKIESIKDTYGKIAYTTDVVCSTPIYGNAFILGYAGEKCPRCRSYEFSLDESNSDMFLLTSAYGTNRTFGLYKCRKCGLELTEKEYEIAKKLKNN